MPLTIAFDIEALYLAIDTKRRKARMRWQTIAEDTGVSKSTFTRMGYGLSPNVDTLIRVMTWLGETDLAPYIRRRP